MVSVSTSLTKGTDYTDWIDNLARTRVGTDFNPLRQVCNRAEHLYGTACRASGESYLEYALGVAHLLAEMRLDVSTLSAAVLHNPPEALRESPELIQGLTTEVVQLLKGFWRMEAMLRRRTLPTRPEDQEAFRKLLLSLEEDMRVLLIKLAAQTQTLRTAKHLPISDKQRLATETLDLYAPLANRLGIGRLKWALEDLAFRYLEPHVYQQIAKLLDERRLDRERYLQQIIQTLQERLVLLRPEVSGRPKHIYSIWRKMHRKGVQFEQIYDVRAVRILVHTVTDCYTALGVVHALWPPIRGEFDDYIARPKNNFYRSLHTAVVGPDEKNLEIQIRTHDMHGHAELGIAAHWRYKEGGRGDSNYDHRIEWVRQYLALEDTDQPGESLERFRHAIQSEQIHVFTPKGQVIALPRGATPLDFAYHIHSEVGHRCRGAKVDGHIVSLTTSLRSGEQVEILTAKQGGPSRDWLSPGYLHTTRARDKVKQWFHQARQGEEIEQGRLLLERELERREIKTDLDSLSRRLHYRHAEELMAALGRGDVTAGHVGNAVGHLLAHHRQSTKPISTKHAETQQPLNILVQGVGNLITHFAQCCQPHPGDSIVAYITLNQGIRIHRVDCVNLQSLCEKAKNRCLIAEWH